MTEKPNTVSDFEIYGHGILCHSICTSLSPEEAGIRLNREVENAVWKISPTKNFATGEPNPSPCEKNPTTHKHYLFEC